MLIDNKVILHGTITRNNKEYQQSLNPGKRNNFLRLFIFGMQVTVLSLCENVDFFIKFLNYKENSIITKITLVYSQSQ